MSGLVLYKVKLYFLTEKSHAFTLTHMYVLLYPFGYDSCKSCMLTNMAILLGHHTCKQSCFIQLKKEAKWQSTLCSNLHMSLNISPGYVDSCHFYCLLIIDNLDSLLKPLLKQTGNV